MARYRMNLQVSAKEPEPVPGDRNHYQMDFELERKYKEGKTLGSHVTWRRVLPDFDNDFEVYRLSSDDTVEVVIGFKDLSTNDNLIPSYDPAAGTLNEVETPFRNYLSLSTRATEDPLSGQGNSPFHCEEQLRSGASSFFEKLPGPEKTALYYRVFWKFGSQPVYKLEAANLGNYCLSVDMFTNVAQYPGVKRYLVDPELVVRDG